MSALRCRPVAFLMLAVFLAGCTTWRPTTVSPRQVIEEEPDMVRITRGDGTVLTLVEPLIRNDSVAVVEEVCETSTAAGGRFNCPEVVTTVLPVADVAGLEVGRFNMVLVAIAAFSMVLVGAYLWEVER